MNKPITLALTKNQHKKLQSHLFPEDGLEAAAVLLCGRCGKDSLKLTVEKIIFIPYSECKTRTKNTLNWPGEYLENAIDESSDINSSIILIHSHPSFSPNFSITDDTSDQLCIPYLQHGATSIDTPHGSAIMLPNGLIKARIYNIKMSQTELSKIMVIGEDIKEISIDTPKNIMPFTSDMTKELANYTVCIIGVSGTGALTAEMLARLGVGHLILIDFDHIEHKNLNRIPYATVNDANNHELKTTVLRRAILSHHPNTKVTTTELSISNRHALEATSDADIIFCCVDSIEGRYYCDLASQAFIVPLIDMGVTIPTRKTPDGTTVVADVLGRIDYVFPSGPTLMDRGIVTAEGLRSEYLYKVDNNNYQQQVNEGYIKGCIEEAPSVISLNMRTASAAVNEWLSRLYKIRSEDNSLYAQTVFSLTDCDEEHLNTNSFNIDSNNLLGRGLREPLFNLPEFSQVREAA